MKKYILGICSLVAMVACQTFDEPTIKNDGAKKVVVTANISGSEDSRVAMTPGTDEEGRPVIKTNWKESGEKFTVYGMYDLSTNPPTIIPHEFTQVSGNKFEGTLPVGGAFYAFYNCTFSGPTYTALGFNYDVTRQDGTLNDKYVLMMGKSQSGVYADSSVSFDFDHQSIILKPTFKVGNSDIDVYITNIKMGNVLCANTADSQKSQTITVTPSAQDDIYIFLPNPDINPFDSVEDAYQKDHTFTFTVICDNTLYCGSLKLPKSLEVGKFYTATITLEEDKDVCYMMSGQKFRENLLAHMGDNVSIINFVPNSDYAEGEPLPGTTYAPMYFKKYDTHTVELHTSANTIMFNPDCKNMFSGYKDCDGAKKLQRVTKIYFANCDTSQVEDMSHMFDSCHNLINIEGLNTFDTSSATNMEYMFRECGTTKVDYEGFTTYDFSSFDTSKVKNMMAMFLGFRGTSLDLSSFTAESATDVRGMFQDAKRLQTLNLKNFDPVNVGNSNLTSMFYEVGTSLNGNPKTKIYVKNSSLVDRFANFYTTGFQSDYVEFVVE